MAFSVGNGKRGPQAEINVTPLIDVVLVLLIIFMVMTPVMLKELVAKVPQKQTENVPLPPGESSIVVELDARDQLSLNGEGIAAEALARRSASGWPTIARSWSSSRSPTTPTMGGRWRVMDICKGAGAKTLGIVTKDDR